MHPRPLGARSLLVVSVLAAGVASARLARADEAPAPRPTFGSQGQVVFDDLVGAGLRLSQGTLAPNFGLIGYSSDESTFAPTGEPQSRDKLQTFTFGPSMDVFVARHVSLGIELGFSWQKQMENGGNGTGTVWSVSAAPRLGYVVPLGGNVYLWPRIALGAGFDQGHGNANFGHNKGAEEVASLELPLVLTLQRLFFVSFESDAGVEHLSARGTNREEKTTSSETNASFGGFVGAGIVL